MPAKKALRTCEWCAVEWLTAHPTARTCSPLCRARLRETEKPSKGSPPRQYPSDLIERIRDLYATGMTIAEVQTVIGPGIKVQRVMDRYGITRRKAAKRDQSGAKNHMWRGDAANYQALHLRVEAAFGKPSECTRCGTTEDTRYEWANLTGHYEDINDYARMCVTCHRRFDAARRLRTGARTSPARR